MKKPEMKQEIASLKKEVKHLKTLLKEAVHLLSKYKDLVIHPEAPDSTPAATPAPKTKGTKQKRKKTDKA